MPTSSDNALDASLDYIRDNCERAVFTSAVPANYAGVAAVELGEKETPSITAPANAVSGTGRQLVIPAITDGSATDDGDVICMCLVDDTGTELLYTLDVTSFTVTNGSTITTNEAIIYARDPTSV